jgi:hypothetical protein
MNPATLALLIPITAIICGTVVKILGKRGDSQFLLPPDVAGRLEALEGEVTGLRQDLTETQERLDFTERLLAGQKNDPHP